MAASGAGGANEEKEGYIVTQELYDEFAHLPNGEAWLAEIGNQIFKMKRIPESEIDEHTITKEEKM